MRSWPHDTQAEQAVIGCMLLDSEAAERALAVVTPTDFYREPHQKIARAVAEVHRRREPIDLQTVSSELWRAGELENIGGGEYLTACINKVPTASHVLRYATIVAEKSVLREVMRQGQQAIEEAAAEPENVGALLNEVSERIHRLMEQRLSRRFGLVTYADKVESLAEIAIRAGEGRRPLSAARLGIAAVDEMIGPLADQRVVVVKADRGVGKTHIAVNAVYSTAEQLALRGADEWVVVFSFESRGIYARRGLAWRTGIDSLDIHRGFDGTVRGEEWQRLCEEAIALAQWPIAIEEDQRDETEVETQLRLFCRRHRPALVVIDHWQAMTKRPGRTSVEEYEAAAYRMKELADEYAVPMLVLSQVTVNPTTGATDTRGSRAIQDVATMELRLVRDKAGQDNLVCDKMREGIQFSPVAVHCDRARSRFWTQDEWQRLMELQSHGRAVRQHDN